MVKPILMAAGAAVQVVGQISAAQASKRAGEAAARTAAYNQRIRERNEKVAQQQAEIRERVGGQEIADFTERYRGLQAQAATRFRKSGVLASTGTPLQVLLDSDVEADEEKQMIALTARTQAGEMRERGANQRLAGQLTMLEGQQIREAARTASRAQMFAALKTAAIGAYQYRQLI